ncbi:MAG: SpoIIE family protein phosphatase [Planctomycetes bacterium]|nr:SpoIIE family protein phosphatase [Planctomycetota bacterium]
MESPFALEIHEPGSPPRLVAVIKPRTVIGRLPACDVSFADTNVSREHAVVLVEGGTAVLEDLQSRNGTLLNGKRVQARLPLADGDEIRIATHLIRFVAPSARRSGGALDDTAGFVDADSRSMIVSRLDPTDAASGTQTNEDAAAKLRAMLEFSRLIGTAKAVEELLPRLADALCELFPNAERAFVLLVDPASKRPVLRAKRIRGRPEPGPIRLSRSLIEQVVGTRTAILSEDAGADFNMNESIIQSRIQSVLCVPVQRADGEVLGVLYLDSREARSSFTPQDLAILVGLAAQVSRSLEMAVAHDEEIAREKQQRDLEHARTVQRGFLPRELPEIPGYEVYHHYEAARQVGGDLYGYVPLPGGRFAAYLADVSGKGVSAALVMMFLQGEIRFGLASEPDVATALTRISDAFCRSDWDGRFATALVCVIDPARQRATVGNAGHHPLLVRTAAGAVRLVADGIGDLPLGYDPGHVYSACEIDIGPGDTLVFTTDGITEALDNGGGLYGLDRLAAVLAGPGGTAAEVGARILEDLGRHTAGQLQSDDICLMCVRRLPADA